MAYPSRQPSSAIMPADREFFHTVWRLLHQNPATPEPCIFFRTQPELRFFGSDITCIEKKSPSQAVTYEIWVNFMGLIGAQGTLPAYFKEILLTQGYASDNTVQLIYDWLQQRSFQLLYEGWSKRRVLSFQSSKAQPYTRLLASLSGMGDEHPWQKDACTTYLHYFAAHFANPRRPAAALQQILITVLKEAVDIIPIQGAWLPISKEQQSVLGDTKQAILGCGAVMGARVFVPQGKLRIVIGPVDAAELFAFFPGSKKYQLLQQLLERYAIHHYQWELALKIDNSLVQACRLGTTTWNSLGRTSFLGGTRESGIHSTIHLGGIKHYDTN